MVPEDEFKCTIGRCLLKMIGFTEPFLHALMTKSTVLPLPRQNN